MKDQSESFDREQVKCGHTEELRQLIVRTLWQHEQLLRTLMNGRNLWQSSKTTSSGDAENKLKVLKQEMERCLVSAGAFDAQRDRDEREQPAADHRVHLQTQDKRQAERRCVCAFT